MSFSASASSAACTVTVCAVDQLFVVSGDGLNVTSVVRDGVTVTVPLGFEVSATELELPPSATVNVVSLNVTPSVFVLSAVTLSPVTLRQSSDILVAVVGGRGQRRPSPKSFVSVGSHRPVVRAPCRRSRTLSVTVPTLRGASGSP